MTRHTDSEACKLTTCGTTLRAGSVRSQASASLALSLAMSGPIQLPQASELGGCSAPQGCAPAQPAALGPAGGPVAIVALLRNDAAGPAPSSLDDPAITRP
jgi:hypothetical protein